MHLLRFFLLVGEMCSSNVGVATVTMIAKAPVRLPCSGRAPSTHARPKWF